MFSEQFQVTSYLIGIVPTIMIAYFGSRGGNGISKLPTIRVFLLMEFTLWLTIVTDFFLGK
jgi:hypothetical protein